MVDIPINIDTTQANNQIAALNANLNKTAQATQQVQTSAMTYFNYAMHVTNIVMNLLGETARKSEYAMEYAAILNAIQIMQTEVSIGTTLAQASAAFASGNIISGTALTGTAGLMQGLLIQQQAQKAQIKQQQAYMASIKTLTDGWS